jgi:hypothetical protein
LISAGSTLAITFKVFANGPWVASLMNSLPALWFRPFSAAG